MRFHWDQIQISVPTVRMWQEIEAEDKALSSCYPLKTDIVHNDRMWFYNYGVFPWFKTTVKIRLSFSLTFLSIFEIKLHHFI